jgi:membrane protein involved in colicin uptake
MEDFLPQKLADADSNFADVKLKLIDEARKYVEEAKNHVEEAKKHAEEAMKHAEEAKKHAEEAKKHAEEARKHAEEAMKLADEVSGKKHANDEVPEPADVESQQRRLNGSMVDRVAACEERLAAHDERLACVNRLEARERRRAAERCDGYAGPGVLLIAVGLISGAVAYFAAMPAWYMLCRYALGGGFLILFLGISMSGRRPIQ